MHYVLYFPFLGDKEGAGISLSPLERTETTFPTEKLFDARGVMPA